MSRHGITPEKALGWFPVAMRYAGLAIAVYVAVFQDFDRPSLLVLAAGMMGLQNVVKASQRIKGDSDENSGKRDSDGDEG